MIDVATIHELTDSLTEFLSTWATRDDSRPQPDVRLAGGVAVVTLDALTGELYRVRGQLVGEIHASDKAAAGQVDALLGEHRGGER